MVAGRMMMEGHSRLNQALQKFLFLPRRGAPHVLQHFMGVEKLTPVEQIDSMQQAFAIHRSILTQKINLAPQREVENRSRISPAEQYIVITGRHEKQHGDRQERVGPRRQKRLPRQRGSIGRRGSG